MNKLEDNVKLAESVGIQDEYGEDYKATILQIHAFANAIRAAALLEVVELIKGHAEAHSSKVGWHLVSRLDGDIRGLAYADAIESLITENKE